ncbi:MAG: hypothetical protein BGO52_14590 [Sphingobacteriales bacterium 44-61]|nr:MAG: hypothetical protein BGO52_14590 [Sphingobacteriales bacterium 44-61]
MEGYGKAGIDWPATVNPRKPFSSKEFGGTNTLCKWRWHPFWHNRCSKSIIHHKIRCMLTILLLLAAALCFYLFFKSIGFFEKI